MASSSPSETTKEAFHTQATPGLSQAARPLDRAHGRFNDIKPINLVWKKNTTWKANKRHVPNSGHQVQVHSKIRARGAVHDASYFLKSFTAGALGAIMGGSMTHPIDLIKVRLQLQPAVSSAVVTGLGTVDAAVAPRQANLLSMGYHVARNEGARALYKGLTAGLLRQVTFIGSKFSAYLVFKKQLSKLNPMDSPGHVSFTTKAICGLLAGVVGGVSGNPADMVMVRMQGDGRLPLHMRRGYKNVADGMIRVVRDEGLFTLWRGSGPTVCRSMIITAAQLGIYDEAKDFGRARLGLADGLGLHTFAAGMSSLAAALTSNPVDVAKTRLQSMTSAKYNGLLDCMVKTVHRDGPRALYKGLTATYARQLPLNTIRFIAFEKFMKLFGAEL